MPVVINKETGFAENLPDQSALAPHHEVPLYDPQGQPISVPFQNASDLINQGYSQPTPEELQSLLDHAKYNTTSEQLKTAVEGLAEGATFGLSTALEVGSGSNSKDIVGRREANPTIHSLGTVAGTIGSALTGVGAGAAMTKAGIATAEALAAKTALGRVGSLAARSGVENMMFQAGDEASRIFSSDPNQSVESALAHIGLAGALGAGIGGGLGAVPELWNIGPGKKVEQLLNSIKARTGGLTKEVKDAAGINIPIEIEAALAGDQQAVSTLQHLQESSSKAGEKVRTAILEFRKGADEGMAKVLDTTPAAAAIVSEAEVGKSLQSNLLKKLQSTYEPIAKQYDNIDAKFEMADLVPTQKAEITNKLSDLATEEGWIKTPGSSQNKLINRVIDEMPLQENALDIKRYITNLRNSAPYGSENYYAAKKVINVLTDAQETAIGAKLLEKEPLALESYTALKGQYREMMGRIDELNERLHVGKYHSPASFLENLKAMDPEVVLKRLSPAGDTNTMKMLNETYPEIVETIRKHELNKIMKGSAGKLDFTIDPKKFFDRVDKLSPEMKSFVLKTEQLEQLTKIRELVDALPKTTNPSGTARTLDNLASKGAATALGVATGVMSGSGPTGLVVGYLSHLLGKEAPDAARLAFLKFLASDVAVSGSGLKAAAAMAKAAIKGEQNIVRSVDNVFNKEANVLKFPTPKERELLKKQVDLLHTDPERLMSIGGKLGHYLPEHSAALAATTVRNLTYLESVRPSVPVGAPLDGIKKISSTDEAKYERALDIAQNPLIILDDIKKGTLNLADINHIKTMYPALFSRLSNDILQKLIEKKDDGATIPYKTALGISMFTGQPLHSSMKQVSIQSNQMTFVPQPMGGQPQVQPPKNMNSLNKLPTINQLPGQTRERYRSTGHR